MTMSGDLAREWLKWLSLWQDKLLYFVLFPVSMYKIKQIPEDFIVNELNNLTIDNEGKYSYFLLKKKNYNTLMAIKKVAHKLRTNEKNIGFAGNKDKNAVTEQIISINTISKNPKDLINNLKIKDINLTHMGNGNKEVSLGSHQGNDFLITIRNLDENEIEKIKNLESNIILMPNYFGQQRFSKNNHLIGKAMIKKNFSKAIELILESNSDFSYEIKNHLEKNKNDFVGALKKVPLRLLKLFAHSYQSFIFNNSLNKYFKKNKIKKTKLPIIGFGTEINDKEIEIIVNKIMENEKISFRDFIVNSMPELSQEGSERDSFVEVNGFKVIENGNDELNPNKFKIKINFSLPKGSYATVFIDFLLKNQTGLL